MKDFHQWNESNGPDPDKIAAVVRTLNAAIAEDGAIDDNWFTEMAHKACVDAGLSSSPEETAIVLGVTKPMPAVGSTMGFRPGSFLAEFDDFLAKSAVLMLLALPENDGPTGKAARLVKKGLHEEAADALLLSLPASFHEEIYERYPNTDLDMSEAEEATLYGLDLLWDVYYPMFFFALSDRDAEKMNDIANNHIHGGLT